MATSPTSQPNHLFKVRTICAFVTLSPDDFPASASSSTTSPSPSGLSGLERKIQACKHLLQSVSDGLTSLGYEVQTLRVATNPFEEYLACDSAEPLQFNAEDPLSFETPVDRLAFQLDHFAAALASAGITFVSLGPCTKCSLLPTLIPRLILHSSNTFSASADCQPCDVKFATATAKVVKLLSQHTPSGLGNFRFCSSSRIRPNTPFFPAAYSSPSATPDGALRSRSLGVSLGFENGVLANFGLRKAKSIDDVGTVFRDYYLASVSPVAEAAARACGEWKRKYMDLTAADPASRLAPPFSAEYLGLDVSLNPSLAPSSSGSVAAALEQLDQVSVFGRPGTLAAASAVTTAIQSLPLQLVGYCGLMLPACEDRRLSALASEGERGGNAVGIQTLVNVSSVCGVGVDTVPIQGDVEDGNVAGVILDVAALAARWNKPLSCRLFPVPGKTVGEWTEFDSPYLCNCKIFDC